MVLRRSACVSDLKGNQAKQTVRERCPVSSHPSYSRDIYPTADLSEFSRRRIFWRFCPLFIISLYDYAYILFLFGRNVVLRLHHPDPGQTFRGHCVLPNVSHFLSRSFSSTCPCRRDVNTYISFCARVSLWFFLFTPVSARVFFFSVWLVPVLVFTRF